MRRLRSWRIGAPRATKPRWRRAASCSPLRCVAAAPADFVSKRDLPGPNAYIQASDFVTASAAGLAAAAFALGQWKAQHLSKQLTGLPQIRARADAISTLKSCYKPHTSPFLPSEIPMISVFLACGVPLAMIAWLILTQVTPSAVAQVPSGFLLRSAHFCSSGTGTIWVPCSPSSATSAASRTTAAGSITSANAAKSAPSANGTRASCADFNPSSAPLSRFLDATGSARRAATVPIPARGSYRCAAGRIVASDQLSIIGGTTGQTFVVVSQ